MMLPSCYVISITIDIDSSRSNRIKASSSATRVLLTERRTPLVHSNAQLCVSGLMEAGPAAYLSNLHLITSCSVHRGVRCGLLIAHIHRARVSGTPLRPTPALTQGQERTSVLGSALPEWKSCSSAPRGSALASGAGRSGRACWECASATDAGVGTRLSMLAAAWESWGAG